MSKKVIAIILCLCMLSGFAGCGQNAKTTGGENTQGRYVEKQISFPEEVDSAKVFQIAKQDGKLVLYTKQEKSGKTGIAAYQYTDGQFKDCTPAWMAELSFEEEQLSPYGSMKVLEKADGSSYFFCSLIEGENWIGHLYCSSDGKTVTEVTPEDWLKENEEYHFYEYPQDITFLEDGTLLGYFGYRIRVYDSTTMDMKKEITLEKQYDEKIYNEQNTYYMIAKNDNYEFAGIEAFELNSDSPKATMTIEGDMGGSNFLDFLTDGSMILTSQAGIMKKAADTDEWKQVVKGVYTSFAIESMWCLGMTALDSDVYYALFNDDSMNCTLMEYSYDPTISSQPEKTLTVYSVYDNPAVKQAAAMYTRENPNVLVEVETAVPGGEEETTDMNTVLQNLNTKLIAGEGADVLVLDGLDTSAFTEKKLLTDISGLITPMAENGTILKNITDCYVNEDGTMYLVPLKISMNLLIGDKIDADRASTLENLASELSAHEEPVFGYMTAQDLAAAYVPYITTDIVKGKELDKEALSSKLQQLKMIADNGGLVTEYTEDKPMWNIWDIAAKGGAAFYDASGFLQAMFPIAAVKFVNGTFTSFENSFTPVGQIGINAACKDKETAEDFLAYCLSFDMQDGDFYDGFPINTRALENQITKDRTGYEAMTDIELEDGQYVEFIIGVISRENNEKLVSLCKSVNKKISKDAKIEAVIAEALPSYVNGSSTLENTVQQIEKGLNMYLAE